MKTVLFSTMVTLLTAGFVVAAEPVRVVVAGGDLAEIVAALGVSDMVVGVDSTTLYPPALTELPQMGYVRALSAEGVLSLSPDLLLAASDAGPAAVLGQVSAAGVKVALAPYVEGAESVPAKITFVGETLGHVAEAEMLISSYRADMAKVKAAVAGVTSRPKVLFVLSMRDGAPLVAGEGTSAEAMVVLAGGVNAAEGFQGYKPMNREAVMVAAPDVVLMMDGHADQVGGIAAVMARPEIALTPAGKAGRGVTMEGMLLLGFGPRTPEAVRELAAKLHPEDAARLGL